jgi:triosephosphate isomerase
MVLIKNWKGKREREKKKTEIAIDMNYDVASFKKNWSTFICSPETNITRIRRALKLLHPLKDV